MLTGIDISRWQGQISWDKVRAAKDFAIIKLGGSDQGLYPDGWGTRNAQEARRVGIPHGFYFYLGGVTNTAVEVQHILNLVAGIGGLQPGESLWLDWEEAHPNEVTYVREIAQGLIDAGMPVPGVYMSLSRVKSRDWSPVVALNCGLWVAAWGNNDAVPEKHEVPGSGQWPFWAMWQYSSTGECPGIATRVDHNQFSGDVAAFLRYGVKGNAPAPNPVPKPIPAPTPPNQVHEYTVVAGDNMSKIAARYGKTWQQLWDINRDRVSNPDRIFAGQVLRVWAGGTAPEAPKPRIYTVVEGDNLSKIGAKLGISWKQLYDMNRDVIGPNPNFIKPGQQLRY